MIDTRMGIFETARDLAKHVEFCERESARRAEEVQRALERLGDRWERATERLETKVDAVRQEAATRIELLHSQNQTSLGTLSASVEKGFSEIWSRLWWMVGVSAAGVITVIVTVTVYLIERGIDPTRH